MKLIKSSTALLGVLFIMGCNSLEKWEEDLGWSSESINRHSNAKPSKTQVKNQSVKITENRAVNIAKSENRVINRRINTTACKDSDDWYLDGYRVGKSFRAQKIQMLEQRSQYCGYNSKQLPSQYRTNWDRGFLIGTKS